MTFLVVLIIGLAALAAQIVWALARRERAARKAIAIMIVSALVAALLTRFPPSADSPARAIPPDTSAIDAFAHLRREHLTMAGDTGAWLTFAEALEGNGRTADAVAALNDALAKEPKNPDLWIGLANALVLHAEGAVTPAARTAYARGESLGSRRPELRLFRRLACARADGC